MGEKSSTIDGNPSKKPEHQTGSKAGGKNAGSESTSPSSTAGGQEAGGIEGITILTGGEEKGQVVSGVVPGVSKPQKQGKRSKPEAPKGSKQAAAKQVAQAATEHTATMISALIKTISDISALRPGMHHWQFSQAECDAISKPAAEIMAKHNITEKTSEYADYIALIVSVGVAVVPRIMFHMQSAPQKQPEVKQNNVQPISAKPAQPAATQQPDAGTRRANRNEADGGSAAYGHSPIKQHLTPIVG